MPKTLTWAKKTPKNRYQQNLMVFLLMTKIINETAFAKILKKGRLKHIISKRNKLPEKEYIRRHDWVGRVINWKLLKLLNFEEKEPWYAHGPIFIAEIQTYHPTKAIRSEWWKLAKFMNIAVSADHRGAQKETEQIDKHLNHAGQVI